MKTPSDRARSRLSNFFVHAPFVFRLPIDCGPDFPRDVPITFTEKGIMLTKARQPPSAARLPELNSGLGASQIYLYIRVFVPGAKLVAR